MKKLWQKGEKTNIIAEKFTSGNNVILDNQLVTADVWGSIAHAKMLSTINILSNTELQKIIIELKHILELYQKGKFVVKIGDEDVHTKVENFITKKIGDIGKKIHTGRSRNDQVLTDLKLYTKESIFCTVNLLIGVVEELIKFSKKHEYVPMPGYTHMQKAMPSTVGMWSMSFAESLVDDLSSLKNSFEINDQSPLGTGAAYGVSLPINRELTAHLLGFSKVLNNCLYAQSSRPKNHLIVVQALVQIMLTLSRFASDLLLFTTSEFNYFSVSEELCTGSSIMPQKKNLDIMEIVRARTYQIIGFQQIIASITTSLPSGYNSDFQETKEVFMKSFEVVQQSLEIVTHLIKSLTPNVNKLKQMCTPELFATHAAYQLVVSGTPFRKAYQEIGHNLNKLQQYEPSKVIQKTNHIGGPGNLGINKIQKQLVIQTNYWNIEEKKFKKAIINLLDNQ